jgi:hypothetical protein
LKGKTYSKSRPKAQENREKQTRTEKREVEEKTLMVG